MSGSIQPKPFDPNAIKEFINDAKKSGNLVIRTEGTGETKKKVFVYTEKLTWKEKIQHFFGSGAASPKKLIKEMVKQGIYREDLASEVNSRMQGTLSKYLPKLTGGTVKDIALESLVQKGVEKPKNKLQTKLMEAFSSNTPENKELVLNLLKMGVKVAPGEEVTNTDNPVDMRSARPLELAFQYKWTDVAIKLLGQKPPLATKNELSQLFANYCGRNPMNPLMLRALVEAGADIHQIKDKQNNTTSFYWLLQNSDRDNLQIFVQWLTEAKPELVKELHDPVAGSMVQPFAIKQDSKVAILLLVCISNKNSGSRRIEDALILAARTPGCDKLVGTCCEEWKRSLSAKMLQECIGIAKRAGVGATASSLQVLEQYRAARQKEEETYTGKK